VLPPPGHLKKMKKIKNPLSLNPVKGKVDDTPLTVWDAISKCDKKGCRLKDICSWASSKRKIDKCQVESKYITRVTNTLLTNIGSKGDEMQWQRIGLHLIPLYIQLIKMKMVALVVDIEATTKAGPRIHPIFREIREILKAIRSERDSIGIDKISKGMADDPNIDQYLYGDPDYVESLSEQSEEDSPQPGDDFDDI
jgi:hypothetical protein